MKIKKLKVKTRAAAGKSGAKKERGAGRIPAVLYGHGIESLPLAVDVRDFKKLSKEAGRHFLINLQVDGGDDNLAMIKEIQRDPIKENALHIDFQKIKMDEKIHAPVSLNIVGEAIGMREGGIIQHGVWELTAEALPADMPDHLDIDISNLAVGDSFRVKDLPALDKVKLLADEEDVIVSIIPPPTFKEEVEEVEEEGVEAVEEAGGEEAAAEKAASEEQAEEE